MVDVRIWARGGAAVSSAVLSFILTWALLSAALPSPLSAPLPGPVLETVAPSQLAAMGLRLESTLQPVELPDSVTTALGVRLPSTVLLRKDAESVVRQTSGGVQGLIETSLTYATASGAGSRSRNVTMVHRLVWVVVGTRAGVSATSGLLQMLWLVDAHSERILLELVVPTPNTGGGGLPAPSGP
jgi:hypothetical protein